SVVVPTYPALLLPLAICVAARLLGVLDSLFGLASVGAVAVFAYWAVFWWLGIKRLERRSLIEGTRLAFSRGGRDDHSASG
ncbi:MAG: hypothetical protein WCN81_14190, partial [Actinomycetes bacterium]